ncbi:endonuclease/exonuclease/phosphatase family protein [Streptomyces sp. DSM 41014]|uniref:Endonuclease/exonuclease/phosphatase family protein n=1 Tax=Streptomyces hintoniae TaxID=3075521 RepID=A0ABU2UGG9_9ACTN|nr:endonuclease/exonuclease/phosphatase family protein [Streptomyces sp. DSM 41014]MDT0472289.1 endonuclease/exonuclease/phosphatase family protein [Streptomyces sp. DSM 41014]
MRTASRYLLSLFLCLGLLLGAGSARADQPDAQNWPRPRFLTYNVCGGVCAIYQGSRTAWRDTMIHAMDSWDADLLMLQEMCYGQWTLLRDTLAGRTSGGPAYDSVWGAALPESAGCAKWGADTRYGLAIFSKGPAGTIDQSSRAVTFLTQPSGGEQRILLCARTGVRGRTVRACDTHIDYRGANPQAQVAQVAAVTRGYALEGPVVLAGDFNLFPKDARLDPLYDHGGGTGIFQEVDENDKSHFTGVDCPQSGDRCRSGEETAEPLCSPRADGRGKIDYIFLSAYWFTTVRGDAAACTPGMSDHHLLRGAAAWEH